MTSAGDIAIICIYGHIPWRTRMNDDEASSGPANTWYYKLRKVGTGLSISFPRELAQREGFRKGMYVKVVWDGERLTVTPLREG